MRIEYHNVTSNALEKSFGRDCTGSERIEIKAEELRLTLIKA